MLEMSINTAKPSKMFNFANLIILIYMLEMPFNTDKY